MRVKEDYYDNLQRITERFGSAELIPLKLVAEYLGTTDRHLKSDDKFPAKKISGRYYVAAVALARWLS